MTVQLQHVEVRFTTGFEKLAHGSPNEDPDFEILTGSRRYDLTCAARRDVARTPLVEIEAQRVRAGLDCRTRVLFIRDPADLDDEGSAGHGCPPSDLSNATGSADRMSDSPTKKA